jgi:L-ascorbate metabolism protein UlaG (beta-lactamase superfamily)
MAVHLEWVGMACFRLWQDEGPVIAMDPYTPSAIGLVEDGRRIAADTVIVSSLTDVAHANVKLIEGEPQVINALDAARGRQHAQVFDAPLLAVEAAEVADHPDGADDNALYAFNAGGLWFLHMGDLGYGLNEEDLAPFAGRCDVLLALTGEGLTLRLDELDPMIEILKPTWIVPMHYNLAPVSGQKRVMTKLDVFIERRPRDPVIFARRQVVTFPLPASQLGRPTIVVLEPSGYQPV